MKKIALSILLALPFLAFAQQKDYIVTLQVDEYFSSDNSQILGTSNGYEWKVVTEDDYRHYHQYLKGAKRTPFNLLNMCLLSSTAVDHRQFLFARCF